MEGGGIKIQDTLHTCKIIDKIQIGMSGIETVKCLEIFLYEVKLSFQLRNHMQVPPGSTGDIQQEVLGWRLRIKMRV